MTCKSAVWLTIPGKTKQQTRRKVLTISCLQTYCVFKHLSLNSLFLQPTKFVAKALHLFSAKTLHPIIAYFLGVSANLWSSKINSN